jgi:hypothetical protein
VSKRIPTQVRTRAVSEVEVSTEAVSEAAVSEAWMTQKR